MGADLDATTADLDVQQGPAPSDHKTDEVVAASPIVQTIGRYAIIRLLGEGGMGRVYMAYDEQLDRRVAVKVLRRQIDPRAQARVEREARAMAKLSHPNVLQVYEVGRRADELYIAMEFVAGDTLRQWQREEVRPWPELLSVYLQAGEGLAAAHAAGMVHRDFKPDNAMVQVNDGRARVHVLDFGLVRYADETDSVPLLEGSLTASGPSLEHQATLPPGVSKLSGSVSSERLTKTGSVMGTPAYMAPEQFTRNDVEETADQFSFCVALWEGLFGQRPFAGKTRSAIFTSVIEGRIQQPSAERDVPPWIKAVLTRGLSVETADRWPSMRALLNALEDDPERARVSRRGRIIAGVSATALVGIGVLGLGAWVDARSQRCSGAQAKLAGVWDAPRRAEVQAAMLGTGVAYAPRAWEGVAEELDTYATSWSDAHREACVATTVRGEQSESLMDRRMGCLRDAQQQLSAATSVLLEADAKVVEKSLSLVGRLPTLSRCADAEALLANAESPAAAEAEAVDEARSLLAQANAENQAGHNTRAMERLSEAETRLIETEYAPVRIELKLARGRVLNAGGKYQEAASETTDALELATRAGHTSAMRKASTLLMKITGGGLGKPSDALQFRMLAMELPGDDLQRALSHAVLGDILRALGNYDEALDHKREAVAALTEVRGPNNTTVQAARGSLANVLSRQGKFAEAEAEFRGVIASLEATLGPRHPQAGPAYNGLALTLTRQSKYEAAAQAHREAWAILEAAYGPSHPNVARARADLGSVLRYQGKYEEAEAELRAAHAIWLELHGPNHVDVATSRVNLSFYLSRNNEHAAARAELLAAIDVLEQQLSPEHPFVVGTRNNLASVLHAEKRYAEAEEVYRAVLEVVSKTQGDEHPSVAAGRHNLAATLSAQGKHAEAEAEYRAALALRQKLLDPEHDELASTRGRLAELLLDLGRPDEALPLAEQSWRRKEKSDTSATSRAWCAFLLARVLWRTSREEQPRTRAMELAKRALDAYVEVGESSQADAERVRAWMRRPA